jgi:hypothetical protein
VWSRVGALLDVLQAARWHFPREERGRRPQQPRKRQESLRDPLDSGELKWSLPNRVSFDWFYFISYFCSCSTTCQITHWSLKPWTMNMIMLSYHCPPILWQSWTPFHFINHISYNCAVHFKVEMTHCTRRSCSQVTP